MAIFHYTIKIVGRSKGKSVISASESFRSRPELKKYLYLLKSEVSSEELDDAETDLKIVVGDDWKRNKMLYYTNVRKEGIQIWP